MTDRDREVEGAGRRQRGRRWWRGGGDVGRDDAPAPPPSDEERHRRVAAVWGGGEDGWAPGQGTYWLEHPWVAARVHRRISGDERVDPFHYLVRTHLADRLPLDDALTLGCGTGELERGLCQYGFARRHVGLDLAPGAVEAAASAAREAGLDHLEYRVADLDRIELEPDSADVVLGQYSIHHVERLEELFEQVTRALRPGGLFVLNEFVGPTRFQWTDRQLEAANAALRLIPPRYRGSRTRPGEVKEAVQRPTVEEMIALDPSEAVRSGDLNRLIAERFEVIDHRPFGGTLLHLVLADIAGNFDVRDPTAARFLAATIRAEEELIACGDLEHDFAFAVVLPKSGRGVPGRR